MLTRAVMCICVEGIHKWHPTDRDVRWSGGQLRTMYFVVFQDSRLMYSNCHCPAQEVKSILVQYHKSHLPQGEVPGWKDPNSTPHLRKTGTEHRRDERSLSQDRKTCTRPRVHRIDQQQQKLQYEQNLMAKYRYLTWRVWIQEDVE